MTTEDTLRAAADELLALRAKVAGLEAQIASLRDGGAAHPLTALGIRPLILHPDGWVRLHPTSVAHIGATPGDLLFSSEPEPGWVRLETEAHYWADRGEPEEGSWPAPE